MSNSQIQQSEENPFSQEIPIEHLSYISPSIKSKPEAAYSPDEKLSPLYEKMTLQGRIGMFQILGEMLEESTRGEKDHLWKGMPGKACLDRAALARIRKLAVIAPEPLTELRAPGKSTTLPGPLPLDFGAVCITPGSTPNPPLFEGSLLGNLDQMGAVTPVEKDL